jgi:hypothetical protein
MNILVLVALFRFQERDHILQEIAARDACCNRFNAPLLDTILASLKIDWAGARTALNSKLEIAACASELENLPEVSTDEQITGSIRSRSPFS